jgi:hypothetical protein
MDTVRSLLQKDKSGALEITGGREERPEQVLCGLVLRRHHLTL